MFQQEIRESGYAERLAYGIVLTGGSAQLKDIDELFRRVTGMDVRIAAPEINLDEATRELVAGPAYVTAVGILLRGAGLGACNVIEDRSAAASRRPVNPMPPTQPFQPAQPRPYAPTRPVNTTQPKPVEQTQQAPQPEPEAEEMPETPETIATQATGSGKKERNWRNIFKKTLDKINEGFNAADDEEI